MQLKIKYSLFLFSLLWYTISCKQQHNEKQLRHSTLKSTEPKGNLVPGDSIVISQSKPVDESKLKKVLAGKPLIISINKGFHISGTPQVVVSGTPKSAIPGTDTFTFPQKIPVVEKPISAQIPQAFIVKPITLKNNFSTFGKQHGLQHGIVTSLMQDRLGNLWICTAGGVSKFDGQSFTQYNEKEGLCDNDVRSIMQDRSGNIWFGTKGNGVSKYDGKSFTHLSVKDGLGENFVPGILEDRSGNIWFGTWGGGVTKYDGKFFTRYTQREGLINNYVSGLLQDKAGNIWIGTTGGISKFDGRSFSNYSQNEGLANNDVHCLLEDKSGNIWFGTSGGVSKFNNNAFTTITEKEGLSNNNVFSMLEDRSGNLWLGTFNGVSKFDSSTCTQFTEKEGLGNNDIYTMLEDRNGNIWFGTAGGGVSKYNATKFRHYTEQEGLVKNYVFSIAEDKTGSLWFGTWGGGVSKFDGQAFTNYTEKEGLGNNSVRSIHADRLGNIWFATAKGISKYDGSFFTFFTTAEGLCNNDFTCIQEDRSGKLWFGTTWGVSQFDGHTFTNYTIKKGANSNEILCMLEDRNGSMWFGSTNGAIKYDGHTFKHFTNLDGLNSNTVNSMLEDRSGNIWFATSAGVCTFNGKSFIQFTEKDGLINNFVASIRQDKNGDFWFGTRYGISWLSAEKLALYSKKISSGSKREPDLIFRNYDYDDGFLGVGCNGNAILESKNGMIWVGTNFGATAFEPGNNFERTISPDIQITAVKLFNEKIPWGNLNQKNDSVYLLNNGIKLSDFHFKGLSNWYHLPQQLSLSYKNNYIVFDFNSISLNQTQDIQYQYQLEGLDERPGSLTRQTSASYGNLPAGNYTFIVRAMNSDGYWSREFKYAFSIRAAWWQTLWFRLLLILISVLLLFFGSRFIYRYTLRKQRADLEKKLAVQYERQRISSDLHDEIGSTLSSINIYAGLAKKESNNNSHLDSITQNINEVVNKLDDLVWSINPQYDALTSIENRLNAYAEPASKAKGISFKIENNLLQAEIKLSAQIKHNIYLITKELINNAIKHSGCKQILVKLFQQKNNFIFSVADDGCGFDKNTINGNRNGLHNIVLRVSAMGGTILTESGPGEGTKTTITIPVQ